MAQKIRYTCNSALKIFRGKVFTKQEMDAVCPTLFETIVHGASPTKWKECDTAIKLWTHCTEPGVLVAFRKDEVFMEKLSSIKSIDKKKNTVLLSGYFYSMVVCPIKESTKKCYVNEHTNLGFISHFEVQSKFMENAYPGFIQRAELAIAIGLENEEAVDYALGKHIASDLWCKRLLNASGNTMPEIGS